MRSPPPSSPQFHWDNPGYGSFEDFLSDLRQSKRKSIRQVGKGGGGRGRGGGGHGASIVCGWGVGLGDAGRG